VSYPVKGEELVVVEALKVRALPEGSCDQLLDFLKLYRDAVQIVVNEIWNSNEKLSRRKLHEAFYDKLKRLGFRAHHVKEIYVYAKSIVESVRANGGRKPVLRKLVARMDRYDYKLDLDNTILSLKLHSNYEVKLKLLVSRERIGKFRYWSNYELVVKYDIGEFWVAIYFKKTVKPVNLRTVMAVDVNFNNVTLAVFTPNGRLVKLKRFKTPLRKILTHRIWIERIQRKYAKSWKFTKGVRRVIERHGERVRNISWDYTHKVGNLITELAFKHKSIIVLENLDKLRENAKKGRKFNKKLALWFYRRIQFCIEYEAMERGLRVVKVNPRGTSSKCPKCSSKLVEDKYRMLKCNKCNFVGDRDVTATINLYKKFSLHPRCRELGVSPNTPKQMQPQEAMRGYKNEAMTSNYINLYKS